MFQCAQINQAACDLAREVANEGDALVAGNICQTPSYMSGHGKDVVQKEFQKQIEVFVKNDVDFLLGEVIIDQPCASLQVVVSKVSPAGEETGPGTEKRCYHNLQSDPLVSGF